MIENERQYNITRTQIRRFEEAARARATSQPGGRDLHPLLRRAEAEGIESQLEDLRKEVSEYEALKEGSAPSIALEALEDIPEALIKARIASGLTQKGLGQALGMKEQQVQRYEAARYSSASLSRILDVARALGLRLQYPAQLALASRPAAAESARPRLRRVAHQRGS